MYPNGYWNANRRINLLFIDQMFPIGWNFRGLHDPLCPLCPGIWSLTKRSLHKGHKVFLLLSCLFIRKMKHIAIIFAGLVYSTISAAQKTEQGFDAMFKPANSGWRYYVITEKKDELWYREAYYLPEKTMAMKGWYKDKDGKTAEGNITWYHPNKTVKSSINYKNGKEDGVALRFHDNGMMSDSGAYSNGRRVGVNLGWDKDGNQIDSTNFDGNGNGSVVKWHDNGAVFYSGRVTNDTTRINRWNYYHQNGKQMAIVQYTDGKISECSCMDDAGRTLDASLCLEKEAYFPGDESRWRIFLQRNLNPNVAVKNGAPEGTYMVVAQFVVDKTGQVTEIKALTQFGFGMEDEVIRILRKSPSWVPAIQFGRNVKAYRRQPVTFVVAKS
jgi:antitoxin component YwqK of YwqJK toxin-antitoxin module